MVFPAATVAQQLAGIRYTRKSMYESLSTFLRNLSAQSPLVWAVFVMAVVVGIGLALFAFWELLLRQLPAALKRLWRSRTTAS